MGNASLPRGSVLGAKAALDAADGRERVCGGLGIGHDVEAVSLHTNQAPDKLK